MARKSQAITTAATTTAVTVNSSPSLTMQTEISSRRQPPFLMWYDDNPKTPVQQKIAAAIAAYQVRFPGVQPSLVLVNEAEVVSFEGITVRSAPTVGRYTYWVGQAV